MAGSLGNAALSKFVPSGSNYTITDHSGNPMSLAMAAIPVAKARIDVHPFSITIGPTARRSGRFDVTTPSGLSQYFNVVVYQSSVPGTNKGQRTDAREFDQMQITAAITSDTTLRCEWICNGPIIGNFNCFYQIKN